RNKKHLPENQESVETPNVDRMINAWRIVKLYEPSSDRTLRTSNLYVFTEFHFPVKSTFPHTQFHSLSTSFERDALIWYKSGI
ncbi:hypothetical protein, partial [Lacticaseibacillus paracasei]|uniref:hypothetical protein n=1 Tax=Lacticaseibacillus paracasei TaxID=1597 RepID=UPI0019D40F49